MSERTSDEQIAAFDAWLEMCGHCDGGLPMSCTCPGGDYRNPLFELRNLLLAERNRADVAEAAHTDCMRDFTREAQALRVAEIELARVQAERDTLRAEVTS